MYGTARVTEGGAPEVLQRLAHTYLGPDVIFPGMPDPPRGTSPRSRSSASAASGRGTDPAAERHESRPCAVALFLIMPRPRLRSLTDLS